MARSTPETPSTSAWWVLEISAKRSPSSPSTSQFSHSGLDRSSCWEAIRAGQQEQLLLGARRRQRGVADVVLEVEVGVVDPQRPARLERRRGQLLAVARAPGAAGRGRGRGSRRTPAAGPRRSARRRCACARSAPPGAGTRRRSSSGGRGVVGPCAVRLPCSGEPTEPAQALRFSNLAPYTACRGVDAREAPARGAARLLRGRRPGRADGRARARAVRRARSTCARRSSTTSTWSSSCASAARCSSSPRPRCPRAPPSCSRPTASRPSVHAERPARASCARSTPPARWSPRSTSRRKKFAADGYTIVLIGHAGHEEVEGTMGEAPENIVLVETEDDVDALEVADPERIAYISQTTLSVDETRAIINRLRERFPAIIGPRTDDICYATTNRQAAVKQLAEQCDLVLVIGSRNSSNSNRLVEVAREHGADSHLIDNEREVREEWLEGKRVVGITSGRERAGGARPAAGRVLPGPRAPSDVQELEVVQEDVRFMLPKVIRQAHGGRRLGPRAQLRTLVVSDLHLGRPRRPGRAAPRAPSARRWWARWPASTGWSCSGDVLELRHGPLRDALAAARAGAAESSAPRSGPAARSWSSPATTTTGCCGAGSSARDAAVAARPASPPVESDPRRAARRGWLDALAPARVRVAYPGVWLRDDVYAIHGHYLDRHNTVPILERLGAGADRAGRRRARGRARRRAEDYEAALAPMYAWIDAVAQSGGLRGWAAAAASRSRAWRALERRERGGGGSVRAPRDRALGSRWCVAGLNRAGHRAAARRRVGRRAAPRPALRGVRRGARRASGCPRPHVIFGHTHRAGPLPGDDPRASGAGCSTPAAGCTSPAFIGDSTRATAPTGRGSPRSSATTGRPSWSISGLRPGVKQTAWQLHAVADLERELAGRAAGVGDQLVAPGVVDGDRPAVDRHRPGCRRAPPTPRRPCTDPSTAPRRRRSGARAARRAPPRAGTARAAAARSRAAPGSPARSRS